MSKEKLPWVFRFLSQNKITVRDGVRLGPSERVRLLLASNRTTRLRVGDIADECEAGYSTVEAVLTQMFKNRELTRGPDGCLRPTLRRSSVSVKAKGRNF